MTENKNKTDRAILVVDDDPFILSYTARILEHLGYSQVESAANGTIALGKLVIQEPPFSVIICDLNMPEMDGAEFMRHAAESGFEGGMIFFSGEDNRMLDAAISLAKARNLNVLGALTKPITPTALEDLLVDSKPVKKEKSFPAIQRPLSKAELEDGLKGSPNNELLIMYQPKIHLRTGEVTGVEALARWWNIERGVIGPDQFIHLVESSGLMTRFTVEVLKLALAQTSSWFNENLYLQTAVNLSVNSFSEPEIYQVLESIEKEYGITPNLITLEVTETQATEIGADCLQAIMQMRLKRYGLSIDDFGTGNSSLAQLKNIPFTEMKIDRAFVNGASEDGSALAILQASVELAKKLNMEIVAEGVETKQDWDLVRALGCDYVQGYYCAKPMRAEDLGDFLDNWVCPR